MAKVDINPRIIQQRFRQKNEDVDELARKGYINLGRTLGEGSYAKVKVAESQRLGKKVAVKIVALKNAPRNLKSKFLPRELDILRKLDHPRIIKLFDILRTENKVYVVTELAGHGDLLDYIKLFRALPEERTKIIFRQVVDAVSYCHSLNIIHRDLKCENVLLDGKGDVKLSDFGFARTISLTDHSQTYCGSSAYTAPEVLKGKPYSGPPVDIWSLGVILYIMITGLMPYNDDNLTKLLIAQEKKVLFKSKMTSDACKQLVRSILEFKVRKRATLEEIKSNIWMRTDIIKMTKTPQDQI
ncbi:testis-specific serine/threonine-protein kinase 1-like [Lineus longissimus]|uniref:testis-specific serine/threonine-protein kinase 1-like n=1 Tax=Lineus longissimus TaxID=88925 RepID=UPI00315D5A6D